MITLSDILKIENDDELLSIKEPITGIPVWMLMRNQFMRLIMSDLVFGVSIAQKSSKKLGFKKLFKISWDSLRNNYSTKYQKSYNVCILSSGSGFIEEDGDVYDRIGGYFADAYSQETLLVNEVKNLQWPGFSIHNNIYSNFVHYRSILLRNRFNKLGKSLYIANHAVTKAVANAKRSVQWNPDENNLDHLKNSLAKYLTVFPNLVNYYSNFLKSRNIKILLIEGGCYTSSAAAVYGAKKLGVKVVEYQHGAIYPGHDSYNFASKVIQSDNCRKVLPSYLLSYGDWWHEQFNAPVKKIAIGNPHLEKFANLNSNLGYSYKKKILVLSDGLNTEKYTNLANDIGQKLMKYDWQVKLRPHPQEKSEIKNLQSSKFFSIDEFSTLVESASRANLVLGEATTGLFEASLIGTQPLVWETKRSRFGFPRYPFPSFRNASDVASYAITMVEEKKCNIASDSRKFWKENWRSAYLNFLTNNL